MSARPLPEPTARTERPIPSPHPELGMVPERGTARRDADWSAQQRLAGLRRFALSITVLNVLGHTWFGFETSWAHPFAAIATAYTLECLQEWIDARATGRRPRFREGRGLQARLDFFLSAHISAMAVSMLLYPGDRLWPVMFAAALAVGSKAILRVEVDGRRRHVMNPSNCGIAAALVLFPSVGIAPPYQFTEGFQGIGNWILPVLLIALGTMINRRFTKRLPLIAAWIAGFVLQAAVRSAEGDATLLPSLAPMSGLAFLLFTFYMITDPPTTPSSRAGQVAFGLAVAGTYGALMELHVVFGLFFALVTVCSVRGLWLALGNRIGALAPRAVTASS